MRISIIICLIIFSISSNAQFVISGYVHDKNTGENIIGATLLIKETSVRTYTNNFGFFTIHAKQIPCDIVTNSIGYLNDTIHISDVSNAFKILLMPNNKKIKEVVVKSNKSILKKTEMSTLEIPISQIKQLPAIGGEVDVLKVFQLMPGVQGGNEGTSGLYVRGGTPDQNLILLDDVPLYYVNHIGGFVSVFDINAINNVKLIKGGFPARYGGKLSSVLDIRMKNGNNKKMKGEYSIGIIASKLFLEGPLGKRKKTKFMFSSRRSNFDLASRLLTKIGSSKEYSAGYTFYDLYGKVVHSINKNNSIALSLYNGRDRIFINQKNKSSFDNATIFDYNGNIRWGNILSSIKWNHQYNSSLFGSTTLSYTNFNYNNLFKFQQKDKQTNNLLTNAKQTFNSGVQDIIIKHDIDYNFTNNYLIKLGGNYTHHIFNPGINVTKNSNVDSAFGSSKIKSYESSIYVENEINFTSKLNTNLGLHLNSYFVKSKIFTSLQPRINFNYNLHKNHSVKSSYTYMQQNIHLLSNNGAGIPTDLWVPATQKVKPQYSNQISIGYYYVPKTSLLEFSFEAYYKTLNNQIEFSEGASFFGGANNWEEKVQNNGMGKCYGTEFLMQKKEGKITGWISYTLSYNNRKFDSINKGKWYPYKFDRRHYFTSVVNYKIRKNIILSADFVISSGNAITLPNGKYPTFNTQFNSIMNTNSPIPIFNSIPENTYTYAGRNQNRMPINHRLDLACSFIKEKSKGSREIVISVYNVYSRLNPYFVYFDYDKNKNVHLYQLSLFPIIPSLSYKRNL
jgi:hypothetical protein